MSIKPLIFLFFAWLVWGGFVAQNVLSQNQKNQNQLMSAQLKSEGQMLDWFFQERTLQLRSLEDDEPVMSRYSADQWKSLLPWKGVVFLKGNDVHLYGAFDKVMPDAHRKQLIEKVISLKPTTRYQGVQWDSFQWNGTPFVLGFVMRSYGQQAFIAQGEDWGRTLSIIPSENSWVIANKKGNILFHPDVRYVGQKKPTVLAEGERDRELASTNLVAFLKPSTSASARGLYVQLILVTLGLALISSVMMSIVMKKERGASDRKVEAMQEQMRLEADRIRAQLSVQEVPLISQEHLLKDLSHRVSSSLGRQLEPSLINILGQAQWLLSVDATGNSVLKRSDEENRALETIVREVRTSKSMLEKLLAVAGEQKIDLFPMKLETPVLRVLKRWQPELDRQHVIIEKSIEDTSFFPINSEALEKALSHLIQNSLEALTRKLDKKITVELKDEVDHLILIFQDNGVGIESHHLNSIGDAFFTTKSQAQHLGLGLTEAFGIFKQHHAVVVVTSEMGQFTRFEIRFDKNEAKKLLAKQETIRTRTFEDSVVVPENLPRPVEMTRAMSFIETQVSVAQNQQTAVDEEIEKLLELSDEDFIERPPIQAEEAVEPEVEDFMDVNPDIENPFVVEQDEFEMKVTKTRRDIDA